MDGFLSVFIQSAVDDVGPAHEFGEIGRVVAEFLAGYRGDVLSAGAKGGIEELVAAGIAAKMLAILGRQEGALVVIEPPGEMRVSRVFEIDDGVDVAVEHSRLE